jgi:hypothetical protein
MWEPVNGNVRGCRVGCCSNYGVVIVVKVFEAVVDYAPEAPTF